MADVTIARARLCDVWNEMAPLAELHWREIATHLDVPLDPMLDQYLAIEAADKLRLFVVRSGRKESRSIGAVRRLLNWITGKRPVPPANSGALIGYALYIVGPNPHYRSLTQAVEDIIFLHPDHRHGGLGALLIRSCDDELKAEGVRIVVHHVKVAHPVLGVLLKRQGYQCVEHIYTKRLDQE